MFRILCSFNECIRSEAIDNVETMLIDMNPWGLTGEFFLGTARIIVGETGYDCNRVRL